MLHKQNQKDSNNLLGKIGLGLSLVCVIHCIVSPLFIALLPIVSSTMFHNPAIEILLLGSSFLFIGITNLIGFIRHHKRFAPLAFMFLGFSLIISGHVSENITFEVVGAILGGVFLAYSLYLNQKKTKMATVECCSH